jgi:apolipoprotein N-acyltransferase
VTALSASRFKWVLALLAGAVLPLAYAPYDLFWTAPLAVAALCTVWRGATPAQAFWRGLLFGIGSFGFGVYWVYISIHDFGQAHVLLAAGLTIGLVLTLAAFGAAAGYVAARWFRTDGPVAWLGVIPALWVLTEWMRGWLFSGFGWLALGYSQTDSWLFGYAPLLGLHGVSWAVLLMGGALASLLWAGPRVRGRALVVLALVASGGWLLQDRQWTMPRGSVHSVALVQGAVGQELKWRPEQLAPTLELYGRLTVEAASQAELIVWPEAAIPAVYDEVTAYLEDLRDWAARQGVTVMLGVLISDRPDSFQNAAVMLDEPMQVYVKRHLVPFGEYFPVPGFVRQWMRLQSLPYVDAAPGPDRQSSFDFAAEKLAVTICYEDVFPAEQLPYFPEATLMVNISNDAWFGDSIAAHQHLQIARFRAAEVGRYLLRSTNTGITAIIDPRGRVIADAPQFEPALVTGIVQGFTGATPYVRWRNYPVLIGALLTLLLIQFPVTKLTMRPGT